jgi:membrane-associated protease RseP (regulator of RpoE activity)
MNKKNWTMAGIAVLGAALIAIPGYAAAHRLQEVRTQESGNQQQGKTREMPGPDARVFHFAFGDEGGSYLGVETEEVNADRAKELKLPAERGVVLGTIAPDSPAAKAGLKENDVVTEVNGQHVEGAVQFRRMIREIPAGREVKLTVWRDAHSQTLTATLGKSEGMRRGMMTARPGNFAYRLPDLPEMPDMSDLPEVAEVPGVPSIDMDGPVLFAARPRLGIDAEDLNGQLGNFFGAPEGEGILVRSVSSGSAADKAGLKAGDVITSLNGERIRSVGDLRQKLSARDDDKDKDKDTSAKNRTVKLGVLRDKHEVSLSVELPAPAARTKRLISRRTNI